ncbi:MAG: hydroxyisourate hydrolase, partial [Candidatus Eisenbacteria bacterium]|nr:hydroxyisourate hydrolase [Candidatus Eisenbacteria bacterium]
GRPAVELLIRLERKESDGIWRLLGEGRTDAGGRIGALLAAGEVLMARPHRLVFETGEWFRRQGVSAFHPEVVVSFLPEAGGHYHLPLLLSPFGYSTYRGS